MKYPSFFLLFSLSLLFFSCESSQNSSSQPALDSTQTEPLTEINPKLGQRDSLKASAQFIEGEFTREKAMEVVYGYYDKNMECSKWVCSVPEKAEFGEKVNSQGELHTRASGIFDYQTEEGKQKILVTETLSREKDDWEECHACAPILGAAIFSELEGDWFVMALRKNLGVYGAWGKGPEKELIQIGENHFAILLKEAYTAQGIENGSQLLIGLDADSFKVLLDLPTSYSNEGMYYEDFHPELAEAYDSELSFIAEPGQDHYDLIVTTQGKRMVSIGDGKEEVRPFSEKKRFTLDKGRYRVTTTL